METKKQKEKIAKVMHEFKEGELHIGTSDKIVKNPKQAMAIALSEANASKMSDGGGVWTKEQREKVAKLDKEFEEYVKEKGIQRNSYEASLAWREGGFKKRMGEIFGKEYGKYEKGGGVGSSEYYIFEGYDHFKSKPLYKVSSKVNEYDGEWYTDKKDAELELKSLLNNPKKDSFTYSIGGL